MRSYRGYCHAHPSSRPPHRSKSRVEPSWSGSNLSMHPRPTHGYNNHEWPSRSIHNMYFGKEPNPWYTKKMPSHNHVCNGTWQDGVVCVEQTTQLVREPKWPVQVPSYAARFSRSMRAYHNHSSRVMHVLTTNKYMCKCDAEHVQRHGCTLDQRLTMPTVSHRDQNSWTHRRQLYNCMIVSAVPGFHAPPLPLIPPRSAFLSL